VNLAAEGNLVLLIGKDRKTFIIRLEAGAKLQTHRGVVAHDDILDRPLGRTVLSHIGYPFLVLEPSLDDLIRSLKRITQIMYPKDIGYVLLKMNIGSGRRVVEAGTGSGGLTLALAAAVRPNGKVYSYEMRSDVLRLAARNLERVGLREYVELKERDIAQGFDETEVDACFIDVRTPWDYLAQAHATLKDGGFFGAILPTADQVSQLIGALPEHGFAVIEVEELLLRPYKAVPGRLRPADRMVAHTGYLIFARKIIDQESARLWATRTARRAHELVKEQEAQRGDSSE